MKFLRPIIPAFLLLLTLPVSFGWAKDLVFSPQDGVKITLTEDKCEHIGILVMSEMINQEMQEQLFNPSIMSAGSVTVEDRGSFALCYQPVPTPESPTKILVLDEYGNGGYIEVSAQKKVEGSGVKPDGK